MTGFAATAVAEVPVCGTENEADSEVEELLCRVEQYRWTCLVLKGYDVSGNNWIVALSDHKDCTIQACNRILEELGGISEAIHVKCNVPKFDRP